ncbi:MAG TPA: hypothetical protein VIX63_12660, partial [Vicinamibacterales bacterium]
ARFCAILWLPPALSKVEGAPGGSHPVAPSPLNRIARLRTPAVSFRPLPGPADVGALLASAVSMVLRRVAEPGMPRMSSGWLLSHEQLVGRRSTY